MAASLTSLLTPLTKDGALSTMLSLLAARGFSVTSWGSTSVARALLEVFAQSLADLSSTVRVLAASAFLSTAEGGWLDLVAEEFFGITRRPAVATLGTFTLTDYGGGPHALVAGEVWATDVAGRRYKMVYPLTETLPLNDAVKVSFEAESPGADYNIPAGTSLSLVTALPTVAVTNPIVVPLGTWIVTQGRDAESDEELRQRCRERWSSIGAGVRAAYAFFAKAASEEVTRVRVYEASPSGGCVTVYLAGRAGAVTPAVVSTVLAYLLDGRVPLCVTPYVYSCTDVALTVGGAVTVRSSKRADAEAAIARAITDYEQSLDIGDTVRIAELIDAIMSVDGVVNYAPTRLDGSGLAATPVTHDHALGSSEVARLTTSLTFTEV